MDAVPDLYQLAFIPGAFRCPTCGFQLSKTCINANSGEFGTREQDRQSEPCPNDGTFLVHVTYQERCIELSERLGEELRRIAELEELLSASRMSRAQEVESLRNRIQAIRAERAQKP